MHARLTLKTANASNRRSRSVVVQSVSQLFHGPAPARSALSPLRPAGSPSGSASAAPGLEHKYPKYSLGSRGAGATLKYRK